MALIKCKECGKEISTMADVCPHCGATTRYGKTLKDSKNNNNMLYIGLAVALVGAILFLPSFVTLMSNYNDWYFWNWDTSYAYSTVGKVAVGAGLVSGGTSLIVNVIQKNKK